VKTTIKHLDGTTTVRDNKVDACWDKKTIDFATRDVDIFGSGEFTYTVVDRPTGRYKARWRFQLEGRRGPEETEFGHCDILSDGGGI
jgi:hypothetical protein